MAYSVVFTPEARTQLIALYPYIATDASPAIAQRFTDAIVNHCERFRELSTLSVRRDDIRPGLHLTNYRGRVLIAFAVEGLEVWIGPICSIEPSHSDHKLAVRERRIARSRVASGMPCVRAVATMSRSAGSP